MKYRADVDGIRGISVLSVILYHSGFVFLSGGYVGVDIFFVISGYLITGLVFDEAIENRFTFSNFYKRRVARLLPALCITLFITSLFGFIFYNNSAYDNLGKEIFFSAVGAANLLFAQGVNYFAQDEAIRPLIHLWSLGVEEQFYLVWPGIVILLSSLGIRRALIATLLFFSASLTLSIFATESIPIKAYFYPHYRAFELLIGAATALVMRSTFFNKHQIKNQTRETAALLGLILIITPMFALDTNSSFPGINALWPCVGTALLIAYSERTMVAKALSYSPLVFLGLISYPLYLYHQPTISYLHFFGIAQSSIMTLLVVTTIAVPLSWATYKYVEKPARRLAHKGSDSTSRYVLGSLVGTLSCFAMIGLLVAKTNGLSWRLKALNPFAYEVAEQSSSTFHHSFSRGFNVADTDKGKVLFIGDSVLQHYIYPFAKALDVERNDIDTITRGGCVLLKNVEFQDEFSDISCSDLRDDLYSSGKRYDYIVISQSWDSYDSEILNAPPDSSNRNFSLKKWEPFLKETIEHFRPLANMIIIIGGHPRIDGTSGLQPNILLTKENYNANLRSLKVTNMPYIADSYEFFEQWQADDDVIVVHPKNIWCDTGCKLNDGTWSFFSDGVHISRASTEYVVEKLNGMHQLQRLKSPPARTAQR